MNSEHLDSMETPALQAKIGLIKLEEAVLELLFQEQSYLKTQEINDRLGIDSMMYRFGERAHPIVASILTKLHKERRVEYDKPTYSRWQLTEANRFYLRGAQNHRLKKYDEAIEDFDEAIRLDPKNHIFYIDRAVCKQHLKQFHEALADMDEAILLDINNQDLLLMRQAILSQSQLPINQ